MLRLPSLIKKWETHVSSDDAIKQPPKDPAADATDAVKEAWAKELIAYATTLRACHDTGDWSPLLVEGKDATKFVLQPIDSEIYRELHDLTSLPLGHAERVGPALYQALLVRLALVDIVGAGVAIERKPGRRGWVMAQADVIALLDALNLRIVGELASAIERRQIASPL